MFEVAEASSAPWVCRKKELGVVNNGKKATSSGETKR